MVIPESLEEGDVIDLAVGHYIVKWLCYHFELVMDLFIYRS